MSAPFASASLYVGDLDESVTESMLYDKFHSVGPIVSIRVCRDAVTKKSLGYAYVNFQLRKDAERALDLLNFSELRKKPIRVMWQQRDPSIRKSGVGNIFIKNLDPEIDSKSLMDTFSPFGNILSCKVRVRKLKLVKKNENGETVFNTETKGFGFVHFETQEAADKAIEQVNGKEIEGRKVFVGPFLRKEEREKQQGTRKFTNVYVKNLDISVDDEEFREFMSEYGKIQNSIIIRDSEGKSRGFGFCNYVNGSDAEKAVKELNERTFKEKKLYAARAEKKEERRKRLKKIFEMKKQEMKARYRGLNLYIKNLEDDVDDEQLREMFSKFGIIKSARVMKDLKSGASKGFGFVCFTKQEEALKAQSEMNGKMLGNKPLYVAFAQTKEERKLFLERQYRGGMINRHPPGIAAPIAGGPFPPVYAGFRGPAHFPPHMPPQMFSQPNPAGGRGGRWPPNMYVQGGFNPMGKPTQRRQNGQKSKIKYNQNARNTQIKQQPEQTEIVENGQEISPNEAMEASQSQKFLQDLSNLKPDEQKQYLGMKLYPLVGNYCNDEDDTSKITGMLLEMDNGDILSLIENPEALKTKVEEGHTVLKEAVEQE